MEFLPLKLGVSRVTGAQPLSQQSSYSAEDLKQLKAKVFDRDDHTCQCCGFQSKKYQEVLHKDGNQANFKIENLVTTCVFCHQIFHLEKAASMRSGVLIWLPEIDQAALHHMIRAIYVARVTQGPIADAARSAFDMLMARKDEAKKRIGTDDPVVLARAMTDFLEDNEYQYRDKKLNGIRLLPLDRRIITEGDLEFNQFPQMLAYWRSKDGPFGNMMPTSWSNMFESAQASIAS